MAFKLEKKVNHVLLQELEKVRFSKVIVLFRKPKSIYRNPKCRVDQLKEENYNKFWGVVRQLSLRISF